MGPGGQQRIKLFRTYSASWEAWTGRAGLAACPICLAEGDEADFLAGRFDVGHIEPRAIRKSRKVVPLCRSCNGRNNELLDRQLIERRRSALGPNERRGTIKFGRTTARVAVSHGRDQVRILEGSEPGAVRLFDQFTLARPLHLPIHIQVDSDTDWQVEVAQLCAAYLALVRYFLYAPVLMPAYDRVRAQIANPLDRVLPRVFVANDVSFGPWNEHGPVAIVMARPLRMLAVRAAGGLVLLPVADPGDSVYETLETRRLLTPLAKTVELRQIFVPDFRRAPSPSGRWQFRMTHPDGTREVLLGGAEAEERGRQIGLSRASA